ncbi:VEFS-Box domain-containing protein [Chloropicon primus]|nr:VEFS-Box domain-containing protein [Chloropicon primus]
MSTGMNYAEEMWTGSDEAVESNSRESGRENPQASTEGGGTSDNDPLGEEYKRPSLLYSQLFEKQSLRERGESRGTASSCKLFLRRNLSYCRADKKVWMEQAESARAEDAAADPCSHAMVSLNVKLKVTLDRGEGVWVTRGGRRDVTVFCIVGIYDAQEAFIEPISVGAVNCSHGKYAEIDLEFPIYGDGRLRSQSTSQGPSSPNTSASARGDGGIGLMYFVWDDHMDLSSVMAPRRGDARHSHSDGGEGSEAPVGARHLTDRVRRGKIFSVIPDGSEIIFEARPLPELTKDEATGEFSFDPFTELADIGQDVLKLRRVVLCSDGEPSSSEPLNLTVYPSNKYSGQGSTGSSIPFAIHSILSLKEVPKDEGAGRVSKWMGALKGYPAPTMRVGLRYNYFSGVNDGRTRRIKWLKSEKYTEFTCPLCLELHNDHEDLGTEVVSGYTCDSHFTLSSVFCLLKHLQMVHSLFTWELIDTKVEHKQVCYTIEVRPPTLDVFHEDTFFTKQSSDFIQNFNKSFGYFATKAQRRRYEDSLIAAVRSEYAIRDVLAGVKRGYKKKRARSGGAKVVEKIQKAKEARVFYHSRTGQVMTREEIEAGADSDDEGDTNYLDVVISSLGRLRSKFTHSESDFMLEWNRFILQQEKKCQPVHDKEVFHLASKFLEQLQGGDGGSRDCFKQHVLVLWDHGVLTREEARQLIESVF